ncbi:MAG: hypothetical protein ABEH81_13970 [Halopenitus sp.]
MHSEATDRGTRTVAIEGLARDVLVYPVAVLALALIAGTAVGFPTAAVLAIATLALGGLTAAIVSAEDLLGDVVQTYVAREYGGQKPVTREYVAADAAPRSRVSRAGVTLRARVTAVLLSTVGWAGAVVVALA